MFCTFARIDSFFKSYGQLLHIRETGQRKGLRRKEDGVPGRLQPADVRTAYSSLRASEERKVLTPAPVPAIPAAQCQTFQRVQGECDGLDEYAALPYAFRKLRHPLLRQHAGRICPYRNCCPAPTSFSTGSALPMPTRLCRPTGISTLTMRWKCSGCPPALPPGIP